MGKRLHDALPPFVTRAIVNERTMHKNRLALRARAK